MNVLKLVRPTHRKVFIDGQFQEPTCGSCDKAGMIYAEALDGSHKIFIRCHCSWGEEEGDMIPQWNHAMSRDFRTARIPLMRPDLSSLRKNPSIQVLTDDEFLTDPRVISFMQNQMGQSIAWWSMQRKIAVEFWKQYFSEGMNR